MPPPSAPTDTIQRPESETTVAAMFDRVAPRYDLLNRLLSARQDQRWRRQLVRLIPKRPGGRFLDVATGTGDVLTLARRERPEYATWIGVDISPQMLAKARQKVAAQPETEVSAVTLEEMSAERLELPDGVIDCLTISFGLRNVVDRGRALKEFRRVLKPGGALIVLEFFPPPRGLLSFVFQTYFHWILPLVGGLISDRAAYRYLPQSVGSFYSPSEFRTTLAAAGLSVDAEKSFLFGGCRLVRAIKA
jgi:demethylmenaquinone methyltransferase/2-methoxy-6-polyprenyl-1,4-benzoquinol methylase